MSQLINSCLNPTIFSFVALEKIRTGNSWFTQKDSQERSLKLGVNRSISRKWYVIRNAEMRMNSCALIRLLWESRRTAS